MTEEKISLKVVGAIASTGLLAFCGVLAETAMNVAFPTFIKEFQVATDTVQWLTTIYLLALSIVVPLSGFLKHSFKNKTLFNWSIGIFIFGTVLGAIATDFYLLLIGRAIQGFATGIALPLMFNIILEQVPTSKIGMMMGVGSMVPAIAPAVGPIFGGIVITNLGWRYIFWLILPLLLVGFLVGILCIEQNGKLSKQSMDTLGLFYITLFFIGLIYGFSNFGGGSFFSLEIGGAFFLAFLGLLLLIWHSKRVARPILDLSLLKHQAFAKHVLAYFIIQLVLMGLVFILPNYIQIVNGMDAQTSGMMVFPGAFLGAALTPLGGKILDKFGAKKPIIAGSCIVLLSLLAFLVLVDQLTNLQIAGFYVVFTLGISLCFGNLMTSGLSRLVAERQPDGNAIMMTFQQLAGASGTSIVASILAVAQNQGQVNYETATVNGSRNGLLFLLVLLGLELYLLVTLYLKKGEKA